MPPSARNPFHTLRHRNFRLFFTGQFISLVGSWMQVVTQGWLVLELSNSPFQVGLVTTLEALPILLLTLYGGVLADRVDKRRALMYLQTGMLLESLALTLLSVTGHITVGWIMVLAPVLGICTAFEVPIRQAFMMEMVGREDLVNAIALNSSIFNVTRIVGPVIAGALLATLGATACFAVNSASFLAVIVAFVRMRPPFPGALERKGDGETTFIDGARYVLGMREPRTLLSVSAVLSIFGLGACLSMLPVYAKDVLGEGAGGYGGLMAAIGVGAGFGAIAMASIGHRVDRRALISSATLMYAVSIALSALHSSYGFALVTLVFAGLGSVLSAICINTLLQTEAPDLLRGRVIGFYSFVVLGFAPFGSLQAGWIAEHYGVNRSFLMGGLLCGVTGFFFERHRAAGRRQQTSDAAGQVAVTPGAEG
ncbi:MAG TPA: MFS transporter [Gemmatimonadales bacterium]|nr:MFS transporter [Gemmatimonadales bacterium]